MIMHTKGLLSPIGVRQNRCSEANVLRDICINMRLYACVCVCVYTWH